MERFACVTGADRGLGFFLARQMLGQGFTVFAGRYLMGWKELDILAGEFPQRLIPVQVDVGNDESVAEAAAFIGTRTNRLDVLINNAGIPGRGYHTTVMDEELDVDDMLLTFNVTGLGALRMTNALIEPILNSHHRLIVNISSEAGSIGQSWRRGSYGYCMAKTATNMHATITYNRIIDLGGHVLNLHPGGVSGWFGGNYHEGDISPEYSAECLAKIIMRYRSFQTNQPAFLDYQGRKMLW